MTLSYRALSGRSLEEALDDVARLRITVFREFPYLYDGDAAYERRYLESYRNNPDAILVAAFDGRTLVGASTGTPLSQHDEAFAAPVVAAGLVVAEVFYCAESVLLPDYRGQGAGRVFFDMREDHARRLGSRWSAFCAVERAADHSAWPDGYRPLDAFWRRRGYRPLSGAVARFSWREVGQDAETDHRLPFWCKSLG